MYVNEIVNLKLAEAIENPIKLIENIKSNSFMKMRWFSLKNINNSNFKIVDFASFFDIKSYSMLILVIAEFEVRNDTLSQITKTTSFIPMMAYFFSDDIGKNHMPILINKCKDELGADVLLEIHGKDFYVRIIDASVLPEYCENIVNGIIEEYDIKSNMGGRFLYTKAGYYTMFSNLDVFELAKNESSNSI